MHFYRNALAGSLLCLAACGGNTTAPVNGPTPPVSSADVHATAALRFTPANITLVAGGTITFDFEGVAHDVYFDNAPAGAPSNITAPTSNASVARTFTTPGRFAYNCHIHPGMSGVIVVQ